MQKERAPYEVSMGNTDVIRLTAMCLLDKGPQGHRVTAGGPQVHTEGKLKCAPFYTCCRSCSCPITACPRSLSGSVTLLGGDMCLWP